MLNSNLHLSEKIFTNPNLRASRDGYGEGVVIAGEKNENIVVCCADLTESTKSDDFKKKFPTRFFEMGIAEQNMAGVGAGLAFSGKIPFIASYSVFSPGRNWDQIRVSICYSKANVKIIGGHAGLSVGPDGATHQALEDIAITRCLPNMTVIVPCDAEEAKKAIIAAAGTEGPVYIRLGRSKIPEITTSKTSFKIGEALELKKGKDVTIIACGTMVYEALIAAKELKEDVRVINLHTIKPIDEKVIVKAAKETGAIVTVEEHQTNGGMGSAVAEVVAKNHPVPIEFVAVKDSFGESGTSQELLKKYGLKASNIMSAVKEVLKRK